MDKSLEQLKALWSLHKDETSFQVPDDLLHSSDGWQWFTQVETKPVRHKFNDIALQLIKNTSVTD
jgi:hypothetical protein